MMKTWRVVAAVVIVAGLLVGVGIGMALEEPTAGLLIGLGAGLFFAGMLMVPFRLMEEERRTGAR